MKELTLDALIGQDVEKVRQIIAASAEPATRLQSKKNLYTTTVEALSDGTRSNLTQLHYLQAYEQALAIFRIAALELRKEMDILTLEQRLASQQRTLQERKKIDTASDKVGNGEGDTIEDITGNMARDTTRDMTRDTAKDTPGGTTTKTAASDKLPVPLQKQITDAIFFSNRYALYFAGEVGLTLLGGEKADVKSLFSFGSQYDQSTDRDQLTSLLARQAMEDFARIINAKISAQKSSGEKPTDDDLKHTLEAIFTSWINQFNWDTWKDLAVTYHLEDLKLHYQNYSVQAGEFKKKYDLVIVDDKFMKVKKADIIGSEDFVKTLERNLIKLLAYNHERQRNPFAPPGCVFTFGAPGGGKTFIAHSVIQSVAELARELKVPLWAFTHSAQDYASHYQNLTANQLAALGNKIREHPGPVIMYVADFDIIAQSRTDPNLSQEQKQTQGVYFKLFDGTMIPKNGKFTSILDANFVDTIDPATKSRVFDVMLELKRYDKPEQFAEYVKRIFTKEVNGLVRPEQEWREIGEYLLNTELNNREVANILGQLRSNYDVPVEMLTRPFEQQIAYRDEQIHSVTKDIIVAKFKEYITTRMEMERKSREAKLAEDYARFQELLGQEHPRTTTG